MRKSGGDFGNYNGIPLRGAYVEIHQNKLFAPFEEFSSLDIPYVKVAKMLAEKYSKNEWGDAEQNALEAIRQLAAGDHNHLKGDFIISIFLEINKMKPVKGTGKHLTITNKQIKNILLHYAEPTPRKVSIEQFSKNMAISKVLYHRVVGRKYKHKKDNDRINKIAAELGV